MEGCSYREETEEKSFQIPSSYALDQLTHTLHKSDFAFCLHLWTKVQGSKTIRGFSLCLGQPNHVICFACWAILEERPCWWKSHGVVHQLAELMTIAGWASRMRRDMTFAMAPSNNNPRNDVPVCDRTAGSCSAVISSAGVLKPKAEVSGIGAANDIRKSASVKETWHDTAKWPASCSLRLSWRHGEHPKKFHPKGNEALKADLASQSVRTMHWKPFQLTGFDNLPLKRPPLRPKSPQSSAPPQKPVRGIRICRDPNYPRLSGRYQALKALHSLSFFRALWKPLLLHI